MHLMVIMDAEPLFVKMAEWPTILNEGLNQLSVHTEQNRARIDCFIS